MSTFGSFLRANRMRLTLKTKDIATATGIDQALISKFETGARLPTDDQLIAVAKSLDIEYSDIRKHYLAEKICNLLKDEEVALESLTLAEPRIEYLLSSRALDKAILDEAILADLDILNGLKTERERLQDIEEVRKVKMGEYFAMKYTYESNRIEGNTLTLSETHVVIRDGITISGKSMAEHLEAINHSDAIDLLYEMVADRVPFDRYRLLQLHDMILKGINTKYSGVYRDVPVRISGALHIPPQPYMIEKLMEEYFAFYTLHKGSMHPVILAAEMHERLVSIHPFVDGNGRTARLVMNLILLQHGFPIAILKGGDEDRRCYYQALEDVQMRDEPLAFYKLVVQALKESLLEHIELSS